MSKPSDDSFDFEQKYSNPTTASAEAASVQEPELAETTEKIESSISNITNNPVTPAQYIYKSMIPPSTTTTETVEVLSPLGKRERCNTGGSSSRSLMSRERCNTGGSSRSLMSTSGGAGPMMSMDLAFLSSGDVALDGGVGGLGGSDFSMRIQSSDFVQDLLTDAPPPSDLPDSAATAAAALNADYEPSRPELSSAPSRNEKPTAPSSAGEREEEEEDDKKFCPMILNLTAQLGRVSTGESVAPLSENFRVSSGTWVEDFKDDVVGMGAMKPSLFMDTNASRPCSSRTWASDFKDEVVGMGAMDPSIFMDNTAGNSAAQSPAPPTKAPQDGVNDYEVPLQFSVQSHPHMPPLSNSNPLPNSGIVHNLPTTSPGDSTTRNSTSPSSSLTSSKKRKKKRTIDTTRAIEPTDDDVLFGRGGYTNTHRGNIRFREKALELRPWYESVSKEEKFGISQILIESVKGEGHRFLEKGRDGLWHEVVGNGARKKASQALRERIKGGRRKKVLDGAGGGGESNHASSIRSSGSAGGGGNVNVVDGLGDLMPADVVEI